MTTAQHTIFGQVKMGYAIVQSKKTSQWKLFLKEGLGLHLGGDSGQLQSWRIDDHEVRLMVEQGPAEDIQTVGYELANESTLHTVMDRLQDRGIAYENINGEEASIRGVDSLIRLKGPKGLTLELFVHLRKTRAELKMLTSGFITGDAGMGHVAMTSKQPAKVQRFYEEIFDARLSDRIHQPMTGGVMLDISFLRMNERHHSVAIAATRGLRLDPIRTKVQHMNMEVASMADLANACRRCKDLGFEMAHEIGQHPNDMELSFYVLSPSGFEIELGWDALAVDEKSWRTADYPNISTWGHQPQKSGPLDLALLNAGNFARGLRSLTKPEYSPL